MYGNEGFAHVLLLIISGKNKLLCITMTITKMTRVLSRMHVIHLFIELADRYETSIVFSKRYDKCPLTVAVWEGWDCKQMQTHLAEEEAGKGQMSSKLDENSRKLDNNLHNIYRSTEQLAKCLATVYQQLYDLA